MTENDAFTKIMNTTQALGDTVSEALIAGAGALVVARDVADFLRAEGASDADKIEMALRHLNPYGSGVSNPPKGTVYDDPAAAIAENMPSNPSGTSGY